MKMDRWMRAKSRLHRLHRRLHWSTLHWSYYQDQRLWVEKCSRVESSFPVVLLFVAVLSSVARSSFVAESC